MNDGIGPFERPGDTCGIAQVALDFPQLGVVPEILEEVITVKIEVEHGDGVAGIEELRNEAGSHIAGSAGHHDALKSVLHFSPFQVEKPGLSVSTAAGASSAHARGSGHPVLGPGSPLSRGRAENRAASTQTGNCSRHLASTPLRYRGSRAGSPDGRLRRNRIPSLERRN